MALEDPASTHAAEALALRYRDGTPDQILCNDTIARLLGPRTVRKPWSDPLPDALIPMLVAAAQSAPTSSNLRLWSMVAVQDEEKRRELAALARAKQIADDAGEPAEGDDYFESFTMATIGARRAAQNAEIAAEPLGLADAQGGCPDGQ